MNVEIHLKNGDIEIIQAQDVNHFLKINQNINQYQAFISTKLYIPKRAGMGHYLHI